MSKVVVQGKVERKQDKDGKEEKRKFKVKADKQYEVDIDIEIEEDGDYEVEKLSVEGLPLTVDEESVTWLNNFAIKKAGNYINQRYIVIVPGISSGRVVLIDNNSHGKPFFYTGPVENDTIILSDGDPAIGKTG